MKSVIIILLITLLFGSGLYSQNAVNVISDEIEKNNTTLSALRKTVEARKLGNKTEIYLQNPEIEFSYLWGNPSDIGNRTDLRIMQSFDFPSTYSYKNQISNLLNQQVELEYLKQQKEILLKAKMVCYDLIYTNVLQNEFAKMLTHAQRIAESYQLRFEVGETGILELNKAKLNQLNLEKEVQSIEIERNTLLSELSRLNGGQQVFLADTIFAVPDIPVDFEQWYLVSEESNPILKWLKREVEISMKRIELNRASSLPGFQAGYMSESIVNQQYNGVSAGISVPLWQNRNKVRYAKANSAALESVVIDSKLQFYQNLKSLHAKALALQESVDDYRVRLLSLNNIVLLNKALDKGEISLIDYILEQSIYYESVVRMLELERDMNKAIAELNQFIR